MWALPGGAGHWGTICRPNCPNATNFWTAGDKRSHIVAELLVLQRFLLGIVLIATIGELFSSRQCSMIVTVMRYVVSGRRLTSAAKVRVAARSTVSLAILELPSKLPAPSVAGANRPPAAEVSGLQKLGPEARYQPVKEGR